LLLSSLIPTLTHQHHHHHAAAVTTTTAVANHGGGDINNSSGNEEGTFAPTFLKFFCKPLVLLPFVFYTY